MFYSALGINRFKDAFKIVFLSFLICSSLKAMVFDNRYLPLLQYPYIKIPGRESHFTADFFITTASQAAANGQAIGIPELFGPFDQAELAFSMVLAGFPDPLPAGFINGKLPWSLTGKLQTQGLALSWEQYLGGCLSFGALAMILRSNSSINYFFNSSQASVLAGPLSENDIILLDDILRGMLQTLQLTCNHVQQVGPGDVELYLRWSDRWYYSFKLRSFEYGIRAGVLCPTGEKKDINEPASIPFGGNGHWGVYGCFDAEFELKEDWKVGFWYRIIKRFARTSDQRMPIAHPDQGTQVNPLSEPEIFGVITGPARVNPGLSQVFLAYTQWEGIRQGLGVRAQYSMIHHGKDSWQDERIDKTRPVNISQLERFSDWSAEFISLTAFYDFNRTDYNCIIKPIIKACWDIPFTLLVGSRFVHSYKVSLGLEFNF